MRTRAGVNLAGASTVAKGGMVSSGGQPAAGVGCENGRLSSGSTRGRVG